MRVHTGDILRGPFGIDRREGRTVIARFYFTSNHEGSLGEDV